jgi:hypothetical protein
VTLSYFSAILCGLVFYHGEQKKFYTELAQRN